MSGLGGEEEAKRKLVGLDEMGEELHDMGEESEVNARELAVERRLIEKAKREQYQHWEARVYEHRKRSRTERLALLSSRYHFWTLFWWTTVTLLFTVFLGLYLVFQFAFPHITYGADKHLYLLFRLIWVCITIPVVLYLFFSTTLNFSHRLLQSRVVIDAFSLALSLTMAVFGAIMLPSYKSISEGEITGVCEDTDKGDLNVIELCISWRFWFLTCLIVGICWSIRNVAEELLLYKMQIRPDNKEISLTAVKEYYLRILCRHMRKSGVLPPKGAENKVPDLFVHGLKAMNEYILLNKLDAMYRLETRGLKVQSEVVEALREQATAMFLWLDVQRKEYLLPNDFKPVFGSDANLAYLVFNPSLSDEISEAEFVIAIEDTYAKRKNTWQTYNDRLHLARLMRLLIGGAFWVVMIILVLVLAGFSLTAVIIPLASVALGLSFAFGKLLSSMVEAVFLLLLDRPFDVGDSIRLGDKAPPPTMDVVQLGWFRTIAYTREGLMVSIANTSLFTKDISNLSRSKEYVFKTNLQFSHSTPGSVIVEFKESMEHFFKEHSDTYHPQRSWVHVHTINQTNEIVCEIRVAFNGPVWAQQKDVDQLKLETLLYVQQQCKMLGISYTFPSQPVALGQEAPPNLSASNSRIRTSRGQGMNK